MGSGKGAIVRKATRIGVNKTILEFKYCRTESLFGLLKTIRQKLKIFARVVKFRKVANTVNSKFDIKLTQFIDRRLIKN